MEKKLPVKFKKAWVKALRSGKYKQGRGTLLEDNRFCCLGVACSIAGVDKKKMLDIGLIPPRKAFEKVPTILKEGITKNNELTERLIKMNDGEFLQKGFSFKRIATWIEKNL